VNLSDLTVPELEGLHSRITAELEPRWRRSRSWLFERAGR
jgi:hypothetical protein